MIPEVNIISGKASIVSVSGAGGSGGGSESLFLGSKEHLNEVEIDLNAGKIITVQDYEHAKH